jgi:hypothetical protein
LQSLPVISHRLYLENLKMFVQKKPDFQDYLIYRIELTKNWRTKTLDEYTDPRIAFSIKCLAKLQTEIAELSDADYLRLKPYIAQEDGAVLRSAISATARAVGFRHRIRDLPSFVDFLLQVLEEQSQPGGGVIWRC